jgi:aryl-alcohol dehydrogenase-like predicted oxidoreductase
LTTNPAHDATGVGSVRTLTLGRTGLSVPAIGVGTWGYGGAMEVAGRPVGWSGHDDRRSVEALVTAYESGLFHWDTADAYGGGRAERLIGSLWHRVRRDDVVLATKVGWVKGGEEHAYHPAQVRRQLEASLRNLGTDRIDVYYLHRCDFGAGDRYLDGALEVLERARDAGEVRFVGLSDWDTAKVAHYARRIDPGVVQVYRNVLDDDFDASGLRAWAESSGAGVVFFSPLAHGLLLGRYEEPPSFGEGDHRLAMPRFRDTALLAHLRRCRAAVEERFAGRSEPVLHALIGAVVSDVPVACALLGLRTPAHAEAAARAGAVLDAVDVAWIRTLYRELPAGVGAHGNPWRR